MVVRANRPLEIDNAGTCIESRRKRTRLDKGKHGRERVRKTEKMAEKRRKDKNGRSKDNLERRK